MSFLMKNDIKTLSLRLAACRRRFFLVKNDVLGKKCHFGLKKSCFFAILAFLKQKQPFFTPRCSSPYRIVTNPYTLNIKLCQLFFKTFVLYGWAIDFNFCLCPPYRIMTSPYEPKNMYSWGNTTETFSIVKKVRLSLQNWFSKSFRGVPLSGFLRTDTK